MVPGRVIAAAIGLIAFAVAIVAGLAAENPATTTLWRAIVAMVVCYGLGRLIGMVGQRAIAEDIQRYKAEHPIHEPDTDDTSTQQPSSAGDPVDVIESTDEPEPSAAATSDRQSAAA
jgi:hypothetical protein